jgi:hypothetical protein
MGLPGKLVLGAAGIAVAVVLFVVLRPDDQDETGATGATTAAETAAGTETETAATTTEPEPGPRVIRLDVRSEDPGIERFDIDLGERVVLVVRADVVDEVHVHGYDIMGDVAPGHPARIAFRADAPGQFEVELEDRTQQIAQLTVQ